MDMVVALVLSSVGLEGMLTGAQEDCSLVIYCLLFQKVLSSVYVVVCT